MNVQDIFELADENAIKWDGFDEALIGTDFSGRLVYDVHRMIRVLVERDNMTHEEASEFLDFNVLNTYVGDLTPVHVYLA
jgi:hypothetical protein